MSAVDALGDSPIAAAMLLLCVLAVIYMDMVVATSDSDQAGLKRFQYFFWARLLAVAGFTVIGAARFVHIAGW